MSTSTGQNEPRCVAPGSRRSEQMSNIAWIGLGHMGVPMSRNMVQAGHTVRGVDIAEPAREAARANGVNVVGSIAEAVRDAEAVFTMLQSGAVVEEVLTG